MKTITQIIAVLITLQFGLASVALARGEGGRPPRFEDGGSGSSGSGSSGRERERESSGGGSSRDDSWSTPERTPERTPDRTSDRDNSYERERERERENDRARDRERAERERNEREEYDRIERERNRERERDRDRHRDWEDPRPTPTYPRYPYPSEPSYPYPSYPSYPTQPGYYAPTLNVNTYYSNQWIHIDNMVSSHLVSRYYGDELISIDVKISSSSIRPSIQLNINGIRETAIYVGNGVYRLTLNRTRTVGSEIRSLKLYVSGSILLERITFNLRR